MQERKRQLKKTAIKEKTIKRSFTKKTTPASTAEKAAS